jgi:TonB-dependent starch-binding outer membrane protein SusC
MIRPLFTLLLGFMGFVAHLSAQTIAGKVSSKEAPEGLAGVTILVKGTGTGTATDINGAFTMVLPENATILQCSAIGYLTKEINIGNQTNFDIFLELDVQALNEVVVVGYGTQGRKDLTGSVASVNAKQIEAFPLVSMDRALQGRTAGVQVMSNTGQPGGGVTVRIRGVGTVNNNDPLYVIDGVPVFEDPSSNSTNLRGEQQLQNPLAMLNPNDIESIDILKDASATAIYGSRANNGVVVITTKSGKEGKLRVNYESFAGYNQMALENIDLLNSQEWSKFVLNLNTVSGRPNPTVDTILARIANDPSYPTYDWIGEATQRGQLQSHQLSLSGGNKISKFFISGNYYDENGTIKTSGFKRYSTRINADHQINRWLKIGQTLTLSRTDQRLANTDINNNSFFLTMNRMVPVRPIYTPSGAYSAGGAFGSNQHNIALLFESKETLQTDRILGSVYAEIKLLDGLTFKTAWSIDQVGATQQLFIPPYDIEGGAASRLPINAQLNIQERDKFSWFTDNFFTYQKRFGKVHNLTATLGQSAQLTSLRTTAANATNFIDGEFPYLGNALNQGTVGGGETRNALASYFARLNYGLKDKYLLTATVRRDGSSRFGANNRWGTFPALSLGWRISEESFLRESNVINNLKLRASWGLSGGQEIGNYNAFNLIRTDQFYNFAGAQVGGYAVSTLGNNNLQWEATEQKNIGLDAKFLNGRISLTADYFIKNTTKLLLRVQPPIELGTQTDPFGNLGEIQNNGLELSINTVNLKPDGAFTWTTDLNGTFLRNKVLALANNNARRLTTPFNSNFPVPTFITEVGSPIGTYYLFDVIGIFQNWEEIYASPSQNTPRNAAGQPSLPQTNVTGQTSPGDLIYRDVNGDGRINDDDRVNVGKIIPDFTWGMTHNFAYKGINLSVFFMGVHGVSIYNGIRANQERMTVTGGNARSTVLNAWTPENTNTDFPRAIIQDPNGNVRASTRFLEDGSFIRLRNVRLSYDLPQSLLKRAKIANIQVYFTGVNLVTFTKYTGLDPELGNHNSNPELGNYDAGQYPPSRQYVGGIKIGF